jgi:two-component system alkaline phosphatase synthesis response regulator PhoP
MSVTVMVVDDDRDILELARLVLEDGGYQVIAAASGQAALDRLTQSRPDLILLDVNMPDMDGYAVCRALRTVEKNVPIVFITGKGDVKDFVEGREAGADSYLVKPISRGHLRSVVNLFVSIERKGRAESTPR